MKLLFCFIISGVFIVFATSKCLANARPDSLVVFKAKASSADVIGNYVYILEDTSGKMGIADVAHSPHFIRSQSMVPNLGVSASRFWIKFTIVNPGGLMLDIENPLLEEVSLYSPVDSIRFEKQIISKDQPFYTRANGNQTYTFALKPNSDSFLTYYLEIRSNTQLLVPIRLGPPAEIYKNDLNANLIASLYFGIMLVMLLYNLFVWTSVKDKSYLYYILYLISVTLVQLNITGFGFKYLWPAYPSFEKMGIFLFPSLTAFTSIAFFRQFLRTKQYAPWMHKLFWLFVAAYVFTIGNAIWGDKLLSYNLLNINALPLAICMLGTAAYIMIRYKYRPALFFLIAWTVFIISIVIFVLKDFGILPYNLITASSILLGSATEVVLLSLALADRINTFKKEKEESQAEALASAQENARIIKEQNIMLESKVAERTIELKAANNDLNKALIDLKEAEALMVESEKMASLGQLTAGIAHEINNPINFVSSNIKPLMRDFNILVKMVYDLEKVSYTDLPPDDKKDYIAQYKSENDFDFLKTEIEHLLNGIGDGASRTEEIVKGLRVFSRHDEDDLKQTDINEGLESTLSIINYLLNENIVVVKNYGNTILAECFSGKLNQVFLNIITNAIYAINRKFKGQKGGLLTITTSKNEQTVSVNIADNGVGMDEETRKKIFEPFFTTKDVGEGAGLGLAIAYNTVSIHHGKISVNSTLGIGSEFNIEIPLKH